MAQSPITPSPALPSYPDNDIGHALALHFNRSTTFLGAISLDGAPAFDVQLSEWGNTSSQTVSSHATHFEIGSAHMLWQWVPIKGAIGYCLLNYRSGTYLVGCSKNSDGSIVGTLGPPGEWKLVNAEGYVVDLPGTAFSY